MKINGEKSERETCVLNSIKIYLPCKSKNFRTHFPSLYFFPYFHMSYIFRAQPFGSLDRRRLPQAYRRREIWLLPTIDNPEMWLAPFLPHTPTQSFRRAPYFTQFITVEREIAPRRPLR